MVQLLNQSETHFNFAYLSQINVSQMGQKQFIGTILFLKKLFFIKNNFTRSVRIKFFNFISKI